ncbi:MAG: NUDIX hydrolase [Rhodobacteraceae bacterium]|nr:NUDIX hydrolase [Paracoccaceae bacterium]
MTSEIDKAKIIRDAATIILLRHDKPHPQVLMGQRGSKAVFMPNKFVFPGGAVDAEDYTAPPVEIDAKTATLLGQNSPKGAAQALCTAALRELAEETGLMLLPQENTFRFIFRAITPPGRPRRFDARFFLGDAAGINTNLDDFSNASDELSHLHWIDLAEAKSLDLPFITEVVLSEVISITQNPNHRHDVPFFRHDGGQSRFSLLSA